MIGDARAIPPLIEALGDSDVRVQTQVMEQLRKITGQNFGKDSMKWRGWWERDQRAHKGT
jgi:hypothetical protein